VGEVVVMKRAANSTGVSKKLQDRYRGPLVVAEVLSGDVYRVVELCTGKPRRFATTAHVSQLKSWKLSDSDPLEEGEVEVGTEMAGPTTMMEAPEEQEKVPEEVEGTAIRPGRLIQPPVWMNDFEA